MVVFRLRFSSQLVLTPSIPYLYSASTCLFRGRGSYDQGVPYHVQELDKCPEGKKWAVINTVTGQCVGCHPDQPAAVAQQQALYARVPDSATKKEPVPGKKPAPTFLPVPRPP